MRCGCPKCKTYMVQSESDRIACVCPDCSYRCNACMGTNTLLSPQELRESGEALLLRIEQTKALEDTQMFQEDFDTD